MTLEQFSKLKQGMILVNEDKALITKIMTDAVEISESETKMVITRETLGADGWKPEGIGEILDTDCDQWNIYEGVLTLKNQQLKDIIFLNEIVNLKQIIFGTLNAKQFASFM